MRASPCRILIVLPDLRRGGAQSVLLRLAGSFLDAGREVHLVCLLNDGPLRSMVPAEATLHVLSKARRSGGVWLSMSALPRLAAALHDIAPDAVLSSMTGTNLLTVLACMSERFGGCLVLREASSLANVTGALRRQAMRWLYRRADALIAVSAGVARDLRDLGLAKDRIHVIHNPVDVDRLRNLASVGPPLPGKDKFPYVVSIGRLVKQKDQQTLLRAYAASALCESHRLVIVGEGERRVGLERLTHDLGIGGRVLLAGAMDNPYRVLASASMHVLSSLWEGYPNVLLEALALGVRVVSTDCPYGPREMLDDGRHGRLVPMNDPAALARAMDEELARPSVGTESVIAAHAPRMIASRYLALLDGQHEVSPP